MLDDLKARYAALQPRQQRMLVVACAVGILLVCAYLFIAVFTEEPKQRPQRQDRKIGYELLTGREPESLNMETLVAKLDTVQRRLERVEEVAAKTDARQTRQGPGSRNGAAADASDPELDAMMEIDDEAHEDEQSLRDIRSRRERQRQQPVVDTPAITPMPVTAPPVQMQPMPAVNASGGGSRRIKTFAPKAAESAPSTNDSKPQPPAPGMVQQPPRNVNDADTITLPAGSIISGTLITGMDASSASSARREPFPALLRIKAEAVLPNRYRLDIRECFMVASGYGDLSSERAYLRAEALSCVRDDGTIVESSVDAYAVGEDGKTGIRGRLVSKEGQLIAKSLMAGFLSGVSNIAKPSRVPAFNLAPSDTIASERPDMALVAQEAAYGGISSATAEIAKYYLEMARNMFPVIEVDAGRRIDFIVSRGTRLTPSGDANNDLQVRALLGQQANMAGPAGGLPQLLGIGQPQMGLPQAQYPANPSSRLR